jgi:hypothetical protein
MSTVSKETLLFRETWLRAAKSHKPLRIESPTPAAAQQLRLKFYNSVKGIRNGAEQNYELEEAVSKCTLRIDPEKRTVLILGARASVDPMLAKLEAMLGVKMNDLKTPEQKAAEASLKSLEAEGFGAAVNTTPSNNPYYNRGDL